MRSKAILLALLTLAVGSVRAAFVEPSRAAAAARNVAPSLSARARLGTTVERVATHSTSNDAVFYAIKMKEGGTVFMASDDDEDPVIGYAPGAGDYSTIDRRSPLWAFLNCGVSGRKAVREARLRAQTASDRAALQAAKASWSALAITPQKAPVLGAPLNSGERVPPLVQSTWNQDGYDGSYGDQSKCCYSYYTPVLTNGLHAVCGCVATAMAQIMRYWQYPVCAEKVKRTCYVLPRWERADPMGTGEVVRMGETNLWTSGTSYDWGNMPYAPTADESVRKAIGQLTSDAGISVCMCYELDGSGAFSFLCSDAFRSVFHYEAAAYWNAGSDNRQPTYMLDAQNGVLANLDAGCPTLFSISGAGGHAVVCDGYDYTSWGSLYVHLNMGWSGEGDDFYAFDPFRAGTFTSFGGAVINIFPHGDENTSIISGRILGPDGSPVAGAKVTLYKSDDMVPLTNVTTSAAGVYAVFVDDFTDGDEVAKYDLEAVSPDGKTVARKAAVRARHTVVKSASVSPCVINDNPPSGQNSWVVTYKTDTWVSQVGNSWGNDMTLEDPAVIVTTSGGEFRSMDLPRALHAAATLPRATDDEAVDIAIFKPLDLPAETWQLGFNCRFHAEGDADDLHVACAVGCSLVVREGYRALFTNVVFTTVGTGLVVETNAVAAFAGKVGLSPVDLSVGGQLEIAGALDAGYAHVVNDGRPAEVQVSEPFGFASVDYETATNCASLFVNANDEDRVGVASDAPGVPLVWGVAPIPDSAAAATLVQNGTRVNYRKLATALQSVTGDADLMVRKSCALQCPISVVGRKLTLRAEGSGVLITPVGEFDASPITSIEIGSGGELALSNVVLRGFSKFAESETPGAVFVHVLGGGVFRMQDGARLEDIKNAYGTYGAVEAENGAKIVMEEGSAIVGCTSRNWGGGIYLRQGSELDLCGGAISNCTATTSGGGIYAEKSVIAVSGPSVVWNNAHGSSEGAAAAPDNIYASSKFSASPLEVAGSVAGGRVGVKFAKDSMNALGGVVATFANGLSDGEKSASAEAFSSDVNNDWYAGVVGAVSDDGTKLVWGPTNRESGTVPEEEGTIRVDRAGKVLYFKEVQPAFDRLTGGVARVTLLDSGLLRGTNGQVVVRGEVTLDGSGLVLGREGDFRFLIAGEGNSLTLTNVTLKGQTLQGGDAGDISLVRVEDGGLAVLDDGTTVCNVTGSSSENRTSAAVSVWNANLVMRDGAVVRDCVNGVKDGAGGGIIVAGTNSVFRFEGGEVTGCKAATGGGVQIDNVSLFVVSGSGRITGNTGGNVYVSDKSYLVLEDVFSGKIGHTEGVKADANVFGRVAAGCPKSVEELAPGVKKFFRDADPDITGRIATNDTVALLVWADAFADGVYTDEDGTEYGMVDPGDPTVVTIPTAIVGLVYDGTAKTGVVEVTGCTVEGNVATNAGGYTATATLKPGFVWSDESEDPKSIGWTIACAPVDAPVAVEGLVYNEHEQTGVVAVADAPYTLTENTATNAGDYAAAATLTNANYKWSDDAVNPRQVAWKIAKAQYKMPYEIVFTNCTYVYDGNPKRVPISYRNEDGTPASLPEGVRAKISYEGDDPNTTEVGEYLAEVTFTGPDTENYEPISATKTATLTIKEKEDPDPQPEYTVTTNDPSMTPLAFSAIERIAETEWKLSVTNLLKDADYALSFTADLTTPFTTGAWFRASANGPWTTNVQFSAEDLKPAYFWRAHGRTTYVTNWLNAVQLQPQP